jgi:hypothetical protein
MQVCGFRGGQQQLQQGREGAGGHSNDQQETLAAAVLGVCE